MTTSGTITIPLIKPDLPTLEEIAGPLTEILGTGRVTNFGKYVQQFEAEAARYLGVHVATVSSGTMGLLFALGACSIRAGTRVVVPSFTFMATAQAALYAGGVPLFAECGEDLTLCPHDLARLLSEHGDISAVIGTHAYGLPCKSKDLESLVAGYARTHGRPVPLIYDAAHAFGSAVDGVRVGGFGEAEVFSLSVTKALVSVEGGMVASRNAALIDRVREMRNYGIRSNYNAMLPGMNGKMSEFHAIVGLYNLGRIDALVRMRQAKARYFYDKLRRTRFRTIAWAENVVHTFKDFTVLMPRGEEDRRDALMGFLKERGIETRAYFYPPVHEQEYFKRYVDRPLPATERLSRSVITLPFYSSITHSEIDCIVAALKDFESAV